MLEALQPDFVRWPGGCIVEGLTMDNRIKWKETIGDITKRPGEYNLWGYRSTYGFGYHEFYSSVKILVLKECLYVMPVCLVCSAMEITGKERHRLTD